MATEETLAWEARHRPRAALASILAALVPIATTIGAGPAFSGAPSRSMLTALQRAAEPGPVGTQPSVDGPVAEFTRDHAATFLAFGIAQGLGALLTGYVLWVLARAARARAADLGRAATTLPWVGAGLLALVYVLTSVSKVADADLVLDGPGTVDAAADAVSGVTKATGYIALPAILSFAGALAYVGLTAMRVGLLTRFMGVLGIVIGLAFGFTFAAITPLPLALWLALMVLLFAGRWPNGQPPAWLTGRAEPWPSQQELREARVNAAGKARPEPAAVAAGGGGGTERAAAPHPSSRKKKRKRRA
ncbi:MAG TPA: hypothetical protein VF533_19630 [Solirubrobacteraceae bacterium]|jgi:hypothetical protein